MSWGIVAAAGASVVGSVISSNSADKDREAAQDAAAEQIAFERERYDDWQDTYGNVEDNLSAYYNSLTPDYYAAQGLEAFEKEKLKAQEGIRTSFAQRGIEDSGLALQADLQLENTSAVQRSTIRAQAPSLAAEEQFRFLQAGLGLSPGTSYSQALSEQARTLDATATRSASAAGAATSSAVSSVGTALADYFDKPLPVAPVAASGGDDDGGGGLLDSIPGFSDIRLKENVIQVGELANGIKLYTWTWTEEAKDLVGDQVAMGPMAHEVQEKFPSLVTEREGFLTVDLVGVYNA